VVQQLVERIGIEQKAGETRFLFAMAAQGFEEERDVFRSELDATVGLDNSQAARNGKKISFSGSRTSPAEHLTTMAFIAHQVPPGLGRSQA
jgi:hypothetical protein